MTKHSEEHMMSEPMHAYVVSGGGGGSDFSIANRHIYKSLSERQVPFTPIEGVHREDGGLVVRAPSAQKKELISKIEARPKDERVLLIAHCIGGIAAIGAMGDLIAEREVALVAIAPPLHSPAAVVNSPQSSRKRLNGDTMMRVLELPPGVMDGSVSKEHVIPLDGRYLPEIHESGDFMSRLHRAITAGKAVVHAAEYDWNTHSPDAVRGWHEQWKATLPDIEAQALIDRALIVPNAAHGLHFSPYSGQVISHEENARFQQINIQKAVDDGLRLLS